jgi:hypothetical protein
VPGAPLRLSVGDTADVTCRQAGDATISCRQASSYRFAEIQRAIADRENGRVIKPVLRMTNDELS